MLKQRIITALILLPLVLGGFFGLSGGAFALFTGCVLLLGAWEWARLAGYNSPVFQVLYALGFGLLLLLLYVLPVLAHWVLLVGLLWWLWAVWLVIDYPESQTFWQHSSVALWLGVVLLAPAWQGLQLLKSFSHANAWILWLLLLIWAADIGAYFAGRRFGQHKLAPAVSPGKTWEGAQGGLFASITVTLIAGLWMDWSVLGWAQGIGATLVIVAFSIIGDLTESMFKRSAGLKDSSQLLPGHGGVLDRIDSLTSAIPVFTFLLLLAGWGV